MMADVVNILDEVCIRKHRIRNDWLHVAREED